MNKLALVALVAPLLASGAAHAINPQPLPPHTLRSGAPFLNSGVKALNPQPLLHVKALNPQPFALGSGFVNPGVKALNPQPLPPSPAARFGSGFVNPGVKALNPQPLPPRWQPSQIRIGR